MASVVSGPAVGWRVRPGRQGHSKEQSEAQANARGQFSEATPLVPPQAADSLLNVCLSPAPQAALAPSATLSPAVVPGQAFWRSPLCPWHTKL